VFVTDVPFAVSNVSSVFVTDVRLLTNQSSLATTLIPASTDSDSGKDWLAMKAEISAGGEFLLAGNKVGEGRRRMSYYVVPQKNQKKT